MRSLGRHMKVRESDVPGDYEIYSNGGNKLGIVYWLDRWNSYVFAPTMEYAEFELDRLRSIIGFLEEQNVAHDATD